MVEGLCDISRQFQVLLLILADRNMRGSALEKGVNMKGADMDDANGTLTCTAECPLLATRGMPAVLIVDSLLL